jgi:hypothetical protein
MPANELDRLLSVRDFGPQHYPEVFRRLRDSRLVFLLPYHPELAGGSETVRNNWPADPQKTNRLKSLPQLQKRR